MYQKGNNELSIIAMYTSNYHAEFYLRQISRMSGIPVKTVHNTLAILEQNRILKGKMDGKNKYFTLNLENIETKSYLLKSEIFKMDNFIKSYPKFNLFMKSLSTNTPLILFGSYAKFKPDKFSDVDMLIIADKEPDLPFSLLPFRFHNITMPEETFAKALIDKETLIEEIKENHIILNNHSFYVNMMWVQNAR